MKKIYYLLALVAIAFTACQKQAVVPTPTYTKAMTITLASSDYSLLPTANYAHSQGSFNNTADAKTSIPVILNSKEPQLGNGSTANITFNISVPTIKVASPTLAVDSLFKDLTYTVTAADYGAVNGIVVATGLPKFSDFSPAQVLTFLNLKYPPATAFPNQLAIVTYTLFLGVDQTVTNSFLFLNGAWKKIYMISNAQFASLNNGNNDFGSADLPNLPAYFNGFLKADPSIADTVKAGDLQYVSYKYFVSSANTFQRVAILTYNGTNWVVTTTTATASFLKSNGTWIPDPTVYYTLVSADYTYIGTSTTAGTALARANVAQFPDFNTSASTDATYWSPTDLQNAMIALLAHKYTSPSNGQNFNLTYAVYNFGVVTNVTQTYQWNGTAFVFVK